jgi:hypothetical protein
MSTPDQLLYSALHGTAMRYAAGRRNLDESIEELRQIADGPNDILAEAAGITAGSWYASPATHVGYELIGAGMLILAGNARLQVEQYSAVPGTVVRRLQGQLFEQAVGMCKETSVPGMSWPFSSPYVAEQVELLANRPETMINSKAMHDLG